MKKLLLVVLCLMFSLCGCGNKEIADSGKSNDGKFTFTIVKGGKAKTEAGVDVMNVTIKMDNHSDSSATPIDSGCGVWGFQNGQDMPLEYDTALQENDNYTSVQNGYSLEYNVLLAMKDDSPVTVEVKDKSSNKVIARIVIE